MRLPTIVVALALLPGIVHANGVRYFNNYCSTGTFRSCASVSVSVLHLPGGLTRLQVSIRNLQGTNPADNGGRSILGNLYLRFNTRPPGDRDNNLIEDGPIGETHDGTNSIGQPGGWDRGLSYNDLILNLDTYGSGITGCDVAPFGPPLGGTRGEIAGLWQTCPELGAPGSVIFTFTTAEKNGWNIAKLVEISWHFQNDHGGAGCTPGVDCYQVTAIPEPVTMVLVGTGLVGIGTFQRRRKAREEA